MTRGVRVRLFVASIVVILAVGLTSTLVLRREVAATVDARLEQDVIRQAQAAVIAIEQLPSIGGERGGDTSFRLAETFGARIEVYTADGKLLAGSPDAGGGFDVLGRPEVRAVLAGGAVGLERRGGRIVVAVPWRAGDGRHGFLRLASPESDLAAAYRRLHLLIAIAAIVGIVVAVAMTMLASRLMNRAVRDLATGAREMALGRTRRVAVDEGDELGDVSVWINHLAEDVDRAVASLDHERHVLTSVLDGVSHGVVGLDDDRRITVMNEAARTQLELASTPIGEAFIDHVRLPGLLELLASPDRGPVEVTSPRGVKLTARVVALTAGRGSLLLLEDVTAMRRLETIRQDFVANVSHELRTPVAIIRANAETLQSGAKDEPKIATKLIDGMHRNAERLTHILDDLLDLSRLEAGPAEDELEPVMVREAIDQAVASLGGRAESRGVEVIVDASVELAARGTPHALDQVLVNLIDNAVKYTDKDGKVWVEARAQGDRIRINVCDDGPGIAPRHRERVFERFYRVDPGRSRDLGGTGLGLSIVKHLVENLGGMVGVEPNEPRGTVFWVSLPRVEANDPEPLDPGDTPASTVATL